MKRRNRSSPAAAARTRLPFAAAAGILLLTGAPDARALGPVDLEVEVKGGFGSAPYRANDANAGNILGYGVGGRAGVALHGLYAGISAVNYAGEQVMTLMDQNGVIAPFREYWSRALLAGAEVGYGFRFLGRVTVRPVVGTGDAFIQLSGRQTGGPTLSQHVLYLEPGVTALVAIGPAFVGADLNAALFLRQASEEDVFGFTAHLQAGFRL